MEYTAKNIRNILTGLIHDYLENQQNIFLNYVKSGCFGT